MVNEEISDFIVIFSRPKRSNKELSWKNDNARNTRGD